MLKVSFSSVIITAIVHYYMLHIIVYFFSTLSSSSFGFSIQAIVLIIHPYTFSLLKEKFFFTQREAV